MAVHLVYLCFKNRAKIVGRHLCGVIFVNGRAEIRERELLEREIPLSRVDNVCGEHRVKYIRLYVKPCALYKFIKLLGIVDSHVSALKEGRKTADALANIAPLAVKYRKLPVFSDVQRHTLSAKALGERFEVSRAALNALRMLSVGRFG